jgi:hypothetical protein
MCCSAQIIGETVPQGALPSSLWSGMGKMPALVGAKVFCRACKLLRWPHLLPTLFEGFRLPAGHSGE